MTLQEVAESYQARIRALQSGSIGPHASSGLALRVLIIAIVLFLWLGLRAIRGENAAFWPFLLTPVIVWAIRGVQQGFRGQSRASRLRRYYERALKRVNGEWAGEGLSGDEYVDEHVYARDLSVVGEGSLFELLCTVRTAIGARQLAAYLLETPTLDETRLRQEAVRELRDRMDLRDAVATLGDYEFLEARAQTFEEWLDSEPFEYFRALPLLSAINSAILLGLALCAVTGLLPWKDAALASLPGAALHALAGAFYGARVKELTSNLRPLSNDTQVLRDGLQLIEGLQFQSAKLRGIVAQVSGASAKLGRLKWPLAVIEQRDQDWFYGPSRYLLAGTQACIALETWRRTNADALRQWLAAWADFEALIALATYSYENPDAIFPQFADEAGACFEAAGLGHPLIPAATCVTNDVAVDKTSPFYVVSGSNMSGKSTLLRSIGLNAVLAFSGAPVRAKTLRLSSLSIVASLTVGDSLLNGKSKFMAEVDRLRQAIELAALPRPVLFLVDEIFSGTNSRDRRVAAEAVVRTLVDRGAIGALSTHDLALTEIAGVLPGTNVHMGSRDGSDPMDFDYRLKSGVTTEANALMIARLAGVPV